MAERLKQMKERSKMRRQLLAQQLGVSNQDDFSMILGKKEKLENDSTAAKKSNDFSTDAPKSFTSVKDANKDGNSDLNDSSKDESNSSIYTDSKTFLKGTHSLNPHNDYCQHFVDTLHRPHNFIRDTGIADRFEEYPKLKELIKLKDQIIAERATPPMYLRCDLEEFPLTDLNYEFDVIVIDPPLEEYQRRCPGLMFNWNPWQWDEIIRLEIGQIAAQRSFCFLWCGAAEGLNEGRKCLKQWGFRRCEDICWIKTNKTNPGNTKYMEPNSVLQHTKEHCLMGIKGTVRRSTDGDFIHANVDLDIIISEEPEYGSTDKPEEIFRIVEHFCLGRRRLHVFGNDHTIRPGWVTIGPSLTSSNYSAEQYHSFFGDSPEGATVGSTELIEQLRPKSPPLKIKNQSSGRGRGRGDGDINQGRGQSFGRGSGQRTNFNQRPFISKIGFQN